MIFLDSSIPAEISKYNKMGIIRGVTTNPTIMVKDGVTGGIEGIKKRIEEICKVLHDYPVSVEIVSDNPAEMIKQAKDFHSFLQKSTHYYPINIKIPLHNEKGESYLEVINILEQKHSIPVNVTAMMSAQQGILAAYAGATYVSLFGGRINNMGYNCCGEIKKLRKIIDDEGLETEIIVASVREPLNVIEWLEAGAHIVTVTPDILEKMIVHPYTKETIKMFMEDAKKI